jgi:hypothetical protein
MVPYVLICSWGAFDTHSTVRSDYLRQSKEWEANYSDEIMSNAIASIEDQIETKSEALTAYRSVDSQLDAATRYLDARRAPWAAERDSVVARLERHVPELIRSILREQLVSLNDSSFLDPNKRTIRRLSAERELLQTQTVGLARLQEQLVQVQRFADRRPARPQQDFGTFWKWVIALGLAPAVYLIPWGTVRAAAWVVEGFRHGRSNSLEGDD